MLRFQVGMNFRGDTIQPSTAPKDSNDIPLETGNVTFYSKRVDIMLDGKRYD